MKTPASTAAALGLLLIFSVIAGAPAQTGAKGRETIDNQDVWGDVTNHVFQGRVDTLTHRQGYAGPDTTFVELSCIEHNGPPGWLSLSTYSVVLEPSTMIYIWEFDIYTDATTGIAPGSPEYLEGEIILAATQPPYDSAVVQIKRRVFPPGGIINRDTVSTGFVRLIVSNHAEIGWNGEPGVSMDYSATDVECDATATKYLYSGSPFILRQNAPDQVDLFSSVFRSGLDDSATFVPIDEGGGAQHLAGPNYDGFTTGLMLTPDQTLGMINTYYAPTGYGDSSNFIVRQIEVFSYDSQLHENLSFGSTIDWDVPSDTLSHNVAYISSNTNLLYQRGIDLPHVGGCQPNENRYAAEAFLWSVSSYARNINPCACNTDVYSALVMDLNYSDASSETIWQTIDASAGLTGSSDTTDILTITTYDHLIDLAPDDTLTYWIALLTIRNGDLADLDSTVHRARRWSIDNFWPTGCEDPFSCYHAPPGNVNYDPQDAMDIADLTYLVGYLFLHGPEPQCFEEADCNLDGIIDVGDLNAIIGCLFLGICPW